MGDSMFHIMTFTTLARIATYISLAAPLIAHPFLFFPFIAGKALFFRLFVEIALFALIGALTYKEISLASLKNTLKKPIFLIIAIFIGLFTLSTLFAPVPSVAFWSNFERGEGTWQMLHYFAFFTLLITLFKSRKDWENLITAQTIIASLVGLYAVGQMIDWPAWIINPIGGAKSGTLGNPNYLAIYIVISAFLAIITAYGATGKRKLWLYIASLFHLCIFLSTNGRGAYIGAGTGVLLATILWLLQKKRGWRINTAAALGGLIMIGGITALVLTVKGDAWEDIQPRLWTWESSIAGIIDRPLTGWGAENFPFIFDKYYNPKHYVIESWFDRAHSTPIEYATTGGIPLLAAYIGIFAVLYIRLKKRTNDALWPLCMGLPLIYFINGLVLFEILPAYIVFFVFIAFIDAYTDNFTTDSARTRTNERGLSPWLFYGTAILGIYTIYATIYTPFKKNRMILETMRTDGKTDIEMFQEHQNVLNYRSPIGDQEELQGLLTFTVSYFGFLHKNNYTGHVSKATIDEFMAFNKYWYDKLKPRSVGLKLAYIRATGLLAAYQETKNVTYIQEADIIIAESAALSPTRIEFIRLAMASAALRNDKAAYEQGFKKGKALLPNYKWEPEMKKYVY